MTQPTLRRPLSAWRFLVDAIGALTAPRADVAACDRRVVEVAADSAIGRAVILLVGGCRRVVEGSALWQRSVGAARTFGALPLAERVRAAAVCASVAAATTLALRPFTTEHDPLTWVVPSAVAGAALVAWVLSDGIARAITHYRA